MANILFMVWWEKAFAVKHYILDHSCLLGTTKNIRVTASVIAKRFGDIIFSMPFIRPRNLMALVRKELGVFILRKVYKTTKSLFIKKIEKQYWEDLWVLNNYAFKLKATNPGNNVNVMFQNLKPN